MVRWGIHAFSHLNIILDKFSDASLEVSAAMFQIAVLWVVTPCSVVVGRQHFRRWRQHGCLKHWYPTTTLHGDKIYKTSTWIFTAT